MPALPEGRFTNLRTDFEARQPGCSENALQFPSGNTEEGSICLAAVQYAFQALGSDRMERLPQPLLGALDPGKPDDIYGVEE